MPWGSVAGLVRRTLAGLALIVPLGAAAAGAGGLSLTIESADPLPNYAGTSDPGDLRQLTDGVTTGFPAWSSLGSIGWDQAMTVVLKGRIAGSPGPGPLRLRFLVSRGDYAGVFPPFRIDAYCGDRQGWHHAGEGEANVDSVQDHSAGWLEVPVAADCGPEVAMVLHARGNYLMLDEIEAVPTPADGQRRPGAWVATAVADVRADSDARLRQQFEGADRRSAAGPIARYRLAGSYAWFTEPWGPLGVPEVDPGRIGRKSGHVLATREGPVQFVIGLLNAGPEGRHYRLAGVEPGSGWRVFEVRPVLAASGEVAYDPLVPLQADDLPVPAGSLAYLLVEKDQAGSGSRSITVTADDGWHQDIVVEVQGLPGLPAYAGPPPAINVWAYSGDTPIWSDSSRGGMVNLLRAAGVNVFVVHPRDIPQPGSEDDWAAREARLRAELRIYKGAGTVLLFLGWNGRADLAQAPRSALRGQLGSWLNRIAEIVRSEGYGPDDWALYPLDEPAGAQLEFLAGLAGALKGIDPSVRLYANPGAVQLAELLPGAVISRLMPVIDLWQPLLGTPAQRLASVLNRGSSTGWSVYRVGTVPAKTIPPVCYRRIPLEALRLGASGFGFWSFSDTGGGSAWDDLDGRRPDWAVVYDSQSGVVTSRRWEAFKAGVRDYRQLRACQATRAGLPAGAAADCGVLQADIEATTRETSCP